MDQAKATSPVIMVTGASSGIGEAAARIFAENGYAVVLAARRIERLEAIATEIEAAGGKALAVTTDVTNLRDIEECVDQTLDKFHRLDVLFNNAGFGRLNWLELMDTTHDIDSQLAVNLSGMIHTARIVTPVMMESGKGHIINMASLASLVGMPTYSIYSATKFGVRGFNEALRRELRPWGIHVSIVYPGGVDTEFKSHTGAKRKTGITTPSWVRLTAEDVASVVFNLVKRPRRQVIMPVYMTLVVWMNALFPGLMDRMVEYWFVRREREIKTPTF